jgi:hypothetical protein
MTKLVTNPNYGKIRPGSVMLKDMVRHMEFLSACSSCVGLAPLIKAKSVLASCSDYTTVAFAVWRIMNTLPSTVVPAQRKIDAKEFKKELFGKHGKDDNRVKKVIGESLFNKMSTLIAGETFTPVQFSVESPEKSSGGLE